MSLRLQGARRRRLAAIRAVLAAAAVPEVVAEYEAELDAAFAQARETGDLTVLTTAVRRWWIEALEWQRDSAGQRDFLARMDRYLSGGLPGPEAAGDSRGVPGAAWCLSLFRWELEDLARDQLAGMPLQVQLALSDFMDAVVIVDPAEYQRRPGEPDRPLRTFPFGQAGLVTFLVYEPDDLVLVTRVIWTG